MDTETGNDLRYSTLMKRAETPIIINPDDVT